MDRIVENLLDQLNDDSSIHEEIHKKINKLIEEKIAPKIESTLDEVMSSVLDTTYQKRDVFGEKEGEPFTIKGKMAELSMSFWDQKVDRNGKASTGYEAKRTRIEYETERILMDVVDRALRSDFAKLVNAHREQFKKSLADAVAVYTARMMK